ncbi:MAG: SpoIVB peptidase [Acutalibacteraceae bacterium]|nr:SpoIVB peptidase [Acutalibacteraceae bacterium]
MRVLQKIIKISTVAIGIICTFVLGIGTILGNILPSKYYVTKTGSESLSVYGVTLNSYKNNNEGVAGKLMLGNIIPIKNVEINIRDNEKVIPCGTPFGIKLFTKGVMVVKTDKIIVDNKTYNPARDSGIEIGDIITKVNSQEVNFTEDLPVIVNESNGNSITLTIVRDNKEIVKNIIPVNTGDDSYKIGVWVRDSSAGIGTMTFYHPESHAFGGLGHGICDVDTGTLLPMAQGEVTGAEIESITKAKAGVAGTLNGYHCDNGCTGYVISNCGSGVFGYINQSPIDHSEMTVAYKQQVKTGKAQIITTLDNGSPQYYDIEIESINYNEHAKTKNIVIKITDVDLLNKTNGIVQGMSGSPIIQDNRLVGAVTHVFVNEPNRGYGIFAENMIEDFNEENRKAEKTVA